MMARISSSLIYPIMAQSRGKVIALQY
jgi:hypothetical protein